MDGMERIDELKFSILIPAFKKQYLKEAVTSCLNQKYSKFEVVIVDDCSPENLKSAIDDILDSRVKFYRNKSNFGAINVVDNWNKCLEYSTGDYVICMGDDDRLLPNCLINLALLIKKYPFLNVYHIQTQIIDEYGEIIRCLETRKEFETPLEMLYNRFIGRSQYIGDFCFKSSSLKKEGGFIKFPLAWTSDDITAFRASLPNGIANTQDPGFEYRENRYSISEDSKNDYLKISALKQSEKWYEEILSSVTEDSEKLLKVKSAKISHYRNLYSKHIYGDIRQNPSHFFYWLNQSDEFYLSKFLLFKLAFKGLWKNMLCHK